MRSTDLPPSIKPAVLCSCSALFSFVDCFASIVDHLGPRWTMFNVFLTVIMIGLSIAMWVLHFRAYFTFRIGMIQKKDECA